MTTTTETGAAALCVAVAILLAGCHDGSHMNDYVEPAPKPVCKQVRWELTGRTVSCGRFCSRDEVARTFNCDGKYHMEVE